MTEVCMNLLIFLRSKNTSSNGAAFATVDESGGASDPRDGINHDLRAIVDADMAGSSLMGQIWNIARNFGANRLSSRRMPRISFSMLFW